MTEDLLAMTYLASPAGHAIANSRFHAYPSIKLGLVLVSGNAHWTSNRSGGRWRLAAIICRKPSWPRSARAPCGKRCRSPDIRSSGSGLD